MPSQTTCYCTSCTSGGRAVAQTPRCQCRGVSVSASLLVKRAHSRATLSARCQRNVRAEFQECTGECPGASPPPLPRTCARQHLCVGRACSTSRFEVRPVAPAGLDSPFELAKSPRLIRRTVGMLRNEAFARKSVALRSRDQELAQGRLLKTCTLYLCLRHPLPLRQESLYAAAALTCLILQAMK